MAYATGKFIATVEGAMLTTSPSKGTEQVAVEFRIMEGPDNGARITHYAALTDARLPYTVKELRICGWQGDSLADLSSVIGTEVELVLDEETYNGKTRTKVKFINKPGGAKSAENAPAIAEKWRAKIAALPKDPEPTDPFAG